ncbi:MAG TPA: FHA domain-containing protein [Thermoanaerobaculia bacterium]|nr:FHA domain-containing protein [Thermoanaerobaculia bacterium]
MADKRCENGHFIDESWDLCPYCPADSSEAEIPIVRPSRAVAPAEPAPARPAPAVQPPPVRRDVPPSPMQSPPMERTVAVPKISAADPAQAKRYVVGWLVGLNGSSRGESFPVRIGRNVLGRDRRSDIVVNDEQASSHHADLVFRPEERRFILMDHNSTNGTYVNEMEIEPRKDLAAKDVIRIGVQKFLFIPLIHDGFYWDDEGVLK